MQGPAQRLAGVAPRGLTAAIAPYVAMARIDHWFKNAFMLLGVILAFFHRPELLTLRSALDVLGAAAIACLIASSNYVLNEYLDAPRDRLHPTKRWRPAAQRKVTARGALTLWAVLGAGGIACGFAVNRPFGVVCLVFWLSACAYNVPPVRTKDVPYLDVISESFNNPLRLLLGWFVLVPDVLPSLSLVLAYWMLGALFMSAKRFAEYRTIDDPARAAAYRKSFRHYDDDRLMATMLGYATTGAVFAGVFILRYKLELVLCVPLVASYLAYYALLATRENSPVQTPEKLYREPGILLGAVGILVAFVFLMWVDIPVLYDLFDVRSDGGRLWKIGN